ncbi:class I SAM-dependent methyltransferase [Isoptericola cucumis]|uniref:class I SAM-dependent methyltransferase n=1 Tax=Isoptericola cucumis TaxID=1776856 RepID=UPI00320953DD
MPDYARMYRFGVTPWEGYAKAAAPSIAAVLDREESDRTRPLGTALDLGCGRGQFTPELARRGWRAVGVDVVPKAIEAARRRAGPGVTYLVGDVTDLVTDLAPVAGAPEPGSVGFFLDVGCFQGFDERGRDGEARSVTALAAPGATVLMLAFGPTRLRSRIGGVSQAEVESAFTGWTLDDVRAADTAGLGWPMNRTSPQWYRLRLA